MNLLAPIHSAHAPALIAAAGFVSNIRNPHTRRAYGRSIAEFLAWCEDHGLASSSSNARICRAVSRRIL
jgi:hypothetical protein